MSDTAQAETTPESFDSAESAMRHIFAAIEKKKPAESATPATADNELPDEGDAGPAEEPSTGKDQSPDPAEPPPIERPKSWTESEEAEWRATPRALQQKIAARELERDSALRRSQNDAAEKLKGLSVKEQQAEDARQKYEAKLPEVYQGLVDQNNQQFALIKSADDLQKLANEAIRLSSIGDPMGAQEITSYLQAWQVHQQAMQARKAELDQSNQRKAEKKQSDWATFINENNAKAEEKIPELADKVKSEALVNTAGDMFRDIGFAQADLDGFKAGELISPYDYRMQQVIVDAIRYRQMQQAKATIPAKVVRDLPPVQRPGTSRTGGEASERIQALETKLNNSGSLDDAFALRMARQNAGRRAS